MFNPKLLKIGLALKVSDAGGNDISFGTFFSDLENNP